VISVGLDEGIEHMLGHSNLSVAFSFLSFAFVWEDQHARHSGEACYDSLRSDLEKSSNLCWSVERALRRGRILLVQLQLSLAPRLQTFVFLRFGRLHLLPTHSVTIYDALDPTFTLTA
jgi:hypothetical protein